MTELTPRRNIGSPPFYYTVVRLTLSPSLSIYRSLSLTPLTHTHSLSLAVRLDPEIRLSAFSDLLLLLYYFYDGLLYPVRRPSSRLRRLMDSRRRPNVYIIIVYCYIRVSSTSSRVRAPYNWLFGRWRATRRQSCEILRFMASYFCHPYFFGFFFFANGNGCVCVFFCMADNISNSKITFSVSWVRVHYRRVF